MGEFRFDHKGAVDYLDIATNGNGLEKAMFTLKALQRIKSAGNNAAHVVEVGPGGGAALESLAEFMRDEGNGPTVPQKIDVSLLELSGLESKSLAEIRNQIELDHPNVSTTLINKDIRQLHELNTKVDVVAASAVLHEVYSYCGGYDAIDSSIYSITDTLQTGGYFSYRDVLSLEGISQHERRRHIYDRPSWVTFAKQFLPYYLDNAQHPYHHEDDKVVFEQDSARVFATSIDSNKYLTINAPIGVLRELQRHYITFRDYCWRSGRLGFTPVLEGDLANDWLDLKDGLKRVYYKNSENTKADRLLTVMSEETSSGFRAVDGDTFDATTDFQLESLLKGVESGESDAVAFWNAWLEREGSETYAYMTVGRLLGAVVLRSLEVSDGASVLLPETASDVLVLPRTYYNRFLSKQLSNPLKDGKQLVLFKLMDTKNDRDEIADSLDILTDWCDKETISRVYSPIKRAGN